MADRISQIINDPFLGLVIGGLIVALLAGIILHYLFKGKKEKKIEEAREDTIEAAKEEPVPDTPPEGALPEIWNVPHERNRNFTGREDLLSSLGKALTSGEPTALTQAISGLGGVGKTQLALEYAYRHLDDYLVVWWVRAEEPATLAGDYAALADSLRLPEKDQTDQSIKVKAVRLWLGRNTRWLLVFDNAQGPESVRKYLPQGRTGHVIITSRSPNWAGTAEPLAVNVMEPGEAADFLLKRTSQKDKNSAEKLAKELGFFPLALEQAGAYMESTGKSLSDYLELFGGHRRELMAEPAPYTDYPHTVATTWEIAFNNIKQESPAAVSLLNLLAFLAPEEIPKELIVRGAKHFPKKFAPTAGNPLELDRAVAALRRYSLVEAGEKTLSVHRLVQAVVRDRLAKNAKKTWAGAALRIVNSSFPYIEEDLATWPASALLLPHALAAAGHAEKLKAAPKETGCLLNQMGLYLLNLAELASANSVLERSLALTEKAYGLDHPNLGSVLNNLGIVMRTMGDLEGAKKNDERALSILEEAYGTNHPNVATALNNLGRVLHDMGDLEGAKKNIERALKIDEESYGSNHPEVATDLNNLGNVLQEMGDREGAKKNFEWALKIDEKTYGPNHPEVARIVNNLGVVLKQMGDREGAKKNFERALPIWEKSFGPNHPNVALALNNLGMVLQDMDDLKGAKKNSERALKIDEETYGPNHPKVAIRLNNLGSILKAMGDLKGARKYCERALKIVIEFLGVDHPNTVLVRKNLESLEKKKGG